MSIRQRIEAHGGKVVRRGYRFTIKRGRLTKEALEWLARADVRERLFFEVWPDYDRWAERAAIMEFDGGLDRAEAEALAFAGLSA